MSALNGVPATSCAFPTNRFPGLPPSNGRPAWLLACSLDPALELELVVSIIGSTWKCFRGRGSWINGNAGDGWPRRSRQDMVRIVLLKSCTQIKCVADQRLGFGGGGAPGWR